MSKTPQDHKAKTEKTVEPHGQDEKFVYTSRDGELTFTLPYLENLTRRQVKAVQASKKEDADEVLFELLLSPDEFEQLDDLTLWDQRDLMERWNAESAVQLGNS